VTQWHYQVQGLYNLVQLIINLLGDLIRNGLLNGVLYFALEFLDEQVVKPALATMELKVERGEAELEIGDLNIEVRS